MSVLKVGDKLKCLERSEYPHNFQEGEVYEVSEVDDGIDNIRFKGKGGYWSISLDPSNTNTFYPTFKKINGKWWKESA